MVDVARTIKHFCSGPWLVRKHFSRASLEKIEQAIAASEAHHDGEIRFIVEAGLDFTHLLKSLSPRRRAIDLFSHYRVWDTERNNGILLYFLLSDRAIEIVADRGILAKVPQEKWDAICSLIEQSFRAGEYEKGALIGLEQVSTLLKENFPAEALNRDELPNKPIIL